MSPNTRSPRLTVGLMLIAIAAVHQAVGLLIGFGLDPNTSFSGAPPLVSMARNGLLNSVGTDPWQIAITWFLLWGFVLALVGLVAHEAERKGLALSRTFAVSLAALCSLGVVLMPLSGFWLGFAPAWIAFRRASVGGPVRA
jgi:Family of unknown function (DUF6463)